MEASREFHAVLNRAKAEQKKRGDSFLGVDVLLAALLGDAEVVAALGEAGITKQAIDNALKDVRPAVSACCWAGSSRSSWKRVAAAEAAGQWCEVHADVPACARRCASSRPAAPCRTPRSTLPAAMPILRRCPSTAPT